MLNQFCIWAHEYIQRCEGSNYNHSLLAHKNFYAVCQSIFYIISFRSKDLVSCKKGIFSNLKKYWIFYYFCVTFQEFGS